MRLPAAILVLALAAVVVGFVAIRSGVVVRVYEQVDQLESPAAVVSWSAASLTLADKRSVPLPNVARITGREEDVRRIVESGVDVEANGRVRVVVPVYDGCGYYNHAHPYRAQRLAVDLSVLLVALELAEPDDSFHKLDRLLFTNLAPNFRNRLASGRCALEVGELITIEGFCRRQALPVLVHAETRVVELRLAR